MHRSLTLAELGGRYAIAQMPAESAIPEWALTAPQFATISRTTQELSIVCPQASVPNGVKAQRDWVCLRIEGTFDLSELGVLAAVATPLAAASVSIFAISTYDTDYVLVHQDQLTAARRALRTAGHHVILLSSAPDGI